MENVFNLVIGACEEHTIAGYMPTENSVDIGDYIMVSASEKEWRVVYSTNYTMFNSSEWRVAAAATQFVPRKITKVIKHKKIRWEDECNE